MEFLKVICGQRMLKFTKSTAGSIMPIFALAIAALIGIVATAIALASDSKAATEIQVTADQAAIAGATAFATLETPKADERLHQALKAAEHYAVANSSYTLREIDLDAVTEDSYGKQTTIDVELEFQPANVMARVAGRSGNVSIRRTARAEAVWGFPLCALSLSTSGTGVGTDDYAAFEANNCIVWSNSNSLTSMSFRGATSTARSFCAAGKVIGKHRATPSPEEHCDQIPDPLANWSTPTPGSCISLPTGDEIAELYNPASDVAHFNVLSDTLIDIDPTIVLQLGLVKTALELGDAIPVNLAKSLATVLQQAEISGALVSTGNGSNEIGADGLYVRGVARGLTPSELAYRLGIIDEVEKALYADEVYVDAPTLTLTPNTYCGLDIFAGHVKLEPGVYFIKDAPLTVRRRATLSGEGVTIVMSGQDASFNIIDEARLTLSAPESGDTAGFALVEDKKAIMDGDDLPQSRLAGNGIVSAIGTIYLPRHDFEITGNGSGQQASPLLQVVANTVKLSENGQLKIDFDPTQTQVPVGIKPARTARLVN